MASPLEKARKNPDSMKAKILTAARNLFGEYGYHGTTTRMIAQNVGIDISTLYYHWGEKKDLYDAVMADLNHELRQKLDEVQSMSIDGESPTNRLEMAIDVMSDFLFSQPDSSNLILHGYFSRTRDSGPDDETPEYISHIAYAMGLAMDKSSVSVEAKALVMAVCNSIFTFVSGENFIKPMLEVDAEQYRKVVKDTLKFIIIPAVTRAKIKKEDKN